MLKILSVCLSLFLLNALAPASEAAFERTGKVLTTMTAGLYTYLEVETKSGRYWAAAPKMALSVGDSVDVAPGSEMKDFFSPSLNRKFDTITFTTSVKVIGSAKSVPIAPEAKSGSGRGEPKTVAQILSDSALLSGKRVAVSGTVVKFNGGIMGKNFLHIQDASGKDGKNDLTVTTDQTARVGDKITVTGTVVTNKDFGAGYTYNVLLENASLSPSK
ncbi:MAG TPA: DNA-binding protein [Nitrospiria bacterium]